MIMCCTSAPSGAHFRQPLFTVTLSNILCTDPHSKACTLMDHKTIAHAQNIYCITTDCTTTVVDHMHPN
jgi:hypothetical protein